MRAATRTTGISAGLIAIVAFPLWAGFDWLVQPDRVGDFLTIRLLSEIPLIALWVALVRTPGRRRPELLMLGVMLVLAGGLATMVVSLDQHYGAYALGMSLPIYASAFLLIWSWRYTAALVAINWAVLGVALAVAPHPPGSSDLATVAFYLGTASILAFVGQLHRERLAWREFCGRAELQREQARNHELLEELARLSHEDALTGLANRRSWDHGLEAEIEHAPASCSPIAVLLWDVDNFKDVNDELGHAVGDGVLRSAARLLSELSGDGRLVARLGGDEFAVLCPGCDLAEARELADRLRQGFEERTEADQASPSVTCSIGVAAGRGDEISATELMLQADERLYQAKRTRNAVCSTAASPGPRIGRAGAL